MTERPDWMRNWEQTGLLAFEDKNNDGLIQYYNDASDEFPDRPPAERGWEGNEMVTFNQDNPGAGQSGDRAIARLG